MEALLPGESAAVRRQAMVLMSWLAERHLRVRQRQPPHRLGDICGLAGVFFQKFHPGGGVVEQIPHQKGGPRRPGGLTVLLFLAALNAVEAGVFLPCRAAQQLHPGHTGNGGKRLTPKAQS